MSRRRSDRCTGTRRRAGPLLVPDRHADVVRVTYDDQTFSSEVGVGEPGGLDLDQIEARKSMLETDGA
jgi:hypothetical protein